ncbi:GTF2IRD2 [Cordylochernes scorpioides]|uniref:GTF2IRD2 n=1 Tax=Cordylochernes scorpioides TaxID=51811 RepID=A0ABY6LRC3_9ARAC|nr:GTF2IRD2 [Cordylochernes scorpioides]
MCDQVNAFKCKLVLWEKQLKNEDLMHFPTCNVYKSSLGETASYQKYAEKILSLRNEFETRFSDFKSLEGKFTLFSSIFSINIESVPNHMQMEVIDIQCDSDLKAKFIEVGVSEFYKYLPARFENTRKLAYEIMSMFGSTYRCEQLFSLMKGNKSPIRSRITDVHLGTNPGPYHNRLRILAVFDDGRRAGSFSGPAPVVLVFVRLLEGEQLLVYKENALPSLTSGPMLELATSFQAYALVIIREELNSLKLAHLEVEFLYRYSMYRRLAYAGLTVWGNIAYDIRSPLIRIEGTMTVQPYVDDVLRPLTLLFLQRLPNAIFQQDNARPHTAHISQHVLHETSVLSCHQKWTAIPQDTIESVPRHVDIAFQAESEASYSVCTQSKLFIPGGWLMEQSDSEAWNGRSGRNGQLARAKISFSSGRPDGAPTQESTLLRTD